MNVKPDMPDTSKLTNDKNAWTVSIADETKTMGSWGDFHSGVMRNLVAEQGERELSIYKTVLV